MSKVPPPQFTSIVIKLIALQILAFGVSTACFDSLHYEWFNYIGMRNHLFQDSYSLEQVCGSLLSSPLAEKVENTFVNFLLPFCLKVGGGARGEFGFLA